MDVKPLSRRKRYGVQVGVLLLIAMAALWAYYPIGTAPLVRNADLPETAATLVTKWKIRNSEEAAVSNPVIDTVQVVYGAGYACVRGHMRVDGEPYTYSTVFKHLPLTDQYLYSEKRDFPHSGSDISAFISQANLVLVHETLLAVGSVIIAEYSINWGVIISTLIILFGRDVWLWLIKKAENWT